MKSFLLGTFRTLSKPLRGLGLRRLPFVMRAYQFVYSRLRPKGIVCENILGHTICINSNDSGIAPYVLMGEVFSPGEVKVLKETLKPGMTFVDVGANVGYFTLLAARLVGEGGSVYAFEPEDENFGLLKRNVKENGYSNVITEKKALSNCSGNLAFYIDPKNLCAHSLVPKKGRKEVTIEATTFDEYFVGILPDVVKIDVEGAEPQVLSGMVESLKKKPTLIVEFYPEGLRRAGQDPREYLESIESLGYTFFQITESGSVEVSIETLMSGDSFNKLTNLLCR